MQAVLQRIVGVFYPSEPVYAHCDVPCGIYDPHEAQIAALTVLRMNQLAMELKGSTAEGKPGERATYESKLSRYTATKEAHAEKVKHEIRVIWGDYFTADMAKQFPETGDLVTKIFKQASKARQEYSLESANDLLASVQSFAEIFWKTKKVAARRVPSNQKSGGELILPA